jgi:uncharacterized membrane protein YeaQ/YmgE (transglycosylase-associated protein family)
VERAIATVAWIAFGAVVGLVARWIVPGTAPPVVADILAGVVGAVAGGWAYGTFGGAGATVNLPSMVCAFIGAVGLLRVVRAVRSRSAA